MIGVSVGQYECRHLLGEGGTGAVYLAVHRVLETPRAVKVLFPEWTRYPEIVERFINEARAAASIRHRNIIGVHDCGRLASGEWFILFDYLEGGTLSRFITSHGGPVAEHDVVHLLAEVANGVQAAHDHGIIHRDLKPDNIYLSSRDGDPHYVTILDFGVAKLAEKRGGAVTGPGALVGTTAYMAPEQLRGAKIGPGVDVFALGVIAYQMVAGGRLPFQHETNARDYYRLTAVELYQRITSGPPIDPRRWNANLSEAWIKAIFSALDPEPSKRPVSPRAFALMLAATIPGDGFCPSGIELVRTYARELLEIGVGEQTLRAATEAPSAAAPPARTSRYQVVRRISAGGMAEVFEGAIIGAEGFARRIAIKRVRSELSREEGFAAMFIEEARMASQLSHPNVVSVLDFDRDLDGQLFLVMEYVDGDDLAALLRTGRLPASVAIFVVSEMLRGLAYAHALPSPRGLRGLVHRDLSPHNVLLSREGAVKVSDFGIAQALEHRAVVSSSVLCGKPAYMSPEQVHAEPLDGRSDLFSTGVVLWEMLTGQRLFEGSTKEVLAQVRFKPIPAPSRLLRTRAADLDAVVMKFLERDRSARYDNAAQAIEALLGCADAPRDGRGALVQLLAERSGGSAGAARRAVAARSQRGRGAAAAGAGLGGASHELTATSSRTSSPPGLGAATAFAISTMLAREASRPQGHTPSAGDAASIAAGSSRVVSRSTAGPLALPGPATTSTATRRRWLRRVGRGVAGAAAGALALALVARSVRPSQHGDEAAPAAMDAVAADCGVLLVDIHPRAEVWVDGKAYGATPVRITLAAGRHRVRVVNQHADRTIAVTVTAAKTTRLERAP